MRTTIAPSLPLFSLSLVTGVLGLLGQPALPSALASAALAVAAILLHLAIRRWWTACVAVAVAGAAWTHIVAAACLSGRLAEMPAGPVDTRVTGTVIGLTRTAGGTVSFGLRTRLPGATRHAVRIRLYWYEFPATISPPAPGEVWQLQVRLRRPRGLSNPGGRNSEDASFRKRLAATGYVRRGDNRYLHTAWHGGHLDRWRSRLSERLQRAAGDRVSTPLVIALAVGDRQHLDAQHWRVMRRTGLSHLLAISGLHIGIVAGLGYLVGSATGSFFRRGIGAGCLVSFGMALVYAALAGFTIPTRRALILVTVLLVLRVARRETASFHAFCLALILVLLFDPLSPLDTGFWLSFGAVAIILYAVAGRQGTTTAAGQLWRVQLAVLIGLAPLMLLFFGQVSLLAPLVNLLALPLFSVLVVPAVLAGTALLLVAEPAGRIVLQAVVRGLDFVWSGLLELAGSPLALWHAGPATPWAAAVAIAGALWLLAPRGWPARWLGLLFFLPATWPLAERPAHGEVIVTVLDVGQGLAIVARTSRHTLVFDTGPRWRSGNDAARSVLIPFLRWARVRRVDKLVVSHGDTDHAGGVETLLQYFPDTAVTGSGIGNRASCYRGQRWFWDGVAFEILHPPMGETWAGNDASCVMRIRTAAGCALLTGDIEAAAEQAILTADAALRCDLVIAPHHGSDTSSTVEFVQAVNARQVVFSTGYANRWGFPRANVVDRWRHLGASLHNTADTGAISARLDAAGEITLRLHRCRSRRFWRTACANAR